MKSMIIALMMLCTITVKNAYANDVKVSSAALLSFEKSFGSAENIRWSQVEDLFKVQFSLEGQSLSVWYNEDGEQVAISRTISVDQLPIALKLSLQKNFSSYNITDLFEVDNNEGNNYYVIADNTKTTLKLSSNLNGNWIVFEKHRK
jgi:hypothetical protein